MMNNVYTIYLIEGPRNKPYVGMTSLEPRKRLWEHRGNARSGNETHLYRAMRKYGIDKFDIIPLDVENTQKTAFELERKWIKRLDTYEGWGYNMTPGGNGAPSGEAHPMYGKTGEKNPMYGRERRQYVKNRISAANTGQTHSEQRKEKMRKRMEGNKHSAEMEKCNVAEIKWLSLNTEIKQTKIADEYNTTQSNVSDIKRGERWSNVEPRQPPMDAINKLLEGD